MIGRVPPEYRPTVFLAALCAGLSGVVWIAAQPPAALATAALSPTPRAAEPPAVADVTFVLAPKQTFAEIAERPAFQPTRRPYVPPPPAPPPPPPVAATLPPPPAPSPPPSLKTAYTLVGIVTVGSTRTALLKAASDPTVLRIAEGDALQGWTAQLVEADQVVFQAGPNRDMIRFPDPQLGPAGSKGPLPGMMGPAPSLSPMRPTVH